MDDWFLPAIHGELSVGAGLSAVIQREEARLYFIQALRNSLCCASQPNSDAISSLRQRLHDLDQSLAFRLGMLQPQRPQAWFRPCTAAELGPFPGKISFAALLPHFSPQQSRKVRNQIVQLWSHRQQNGALLPLGNYLWSELFSLNHQWESICRLPEPYQDLRLDELPEGLPDDLNSASLCRYLGNVNRLIRIARQELDASFHRFFRSTERFLLGFYQEPEGHYHSPKDPVGQDLGLRDALSYFKFTSTPELKLLKKRYFELAKKCHPDSPTGSAARFQTLRRHYELVLRVVQPRRL